MDKTFQPMNLNDVLQNRRAIYPKEFTGEHIPDEIVNDLLRSAHLAPSHGNSKPWLFKVFKGEALSTLVEQMKKHHLNYTDEGIRQAKLEKVEKYKKLVSHMIAICVSPSGKYPLLEDTNATAMAVQNLWLSLAEHPTIGGYWSSGNGTYTKEMDAFLGLQDDAFCMGFFLLGAVENKRTKGADFPMDGHVQWM